MKTFLIFSIIFICVNLSAQDIDTTFYISQKDTIIQTIESHVLFLLQQYEQECHSDSTEECGWKFIVTDSFPNGAIGYEQWGCWWAHKMPTFEGFIEWLERRK